MTLLGSEVVREVEVRWWLDRQAGLTLFGALSVVFAAELDSAAPPPSHGSSSQRQIIDR